MSDPHTPRPPCQRPTWFFPPTLPYTSRGLRHSVGVRLPDPYVRSQGADAPWLPMGIRGRTSYPPEGEGSGVQLPWAGGWDHPTPDGRAIVEPSSFMPMQGHDQPPNPQSWGTLKSGGHPQTSGRMCPAPLPHISGSICSLATHGHSRANALPSQRQGLGSAAPVGRQGGVGRGSPLTWSSPCGPPPSP